VRLDHLLSKEHTPLWVAVRVAPIVVVFTSGIIDIPLPVPVLPGPVPVLPGSGWSCVVGRSCVAGSVRVRWVGAHCWGSEESGVLPVSRGCVWGFGSGCGPKGTRPVAVLAWRVGSWRCGVVV
jgi:hypothetical protein